MSKGMLFLPRNFVGLIVAIVGLAIIAGLVFKVLSVINTNNEIESAKNTFEFIMGKIETLEEGQNASIIVQGFRGSENWELVGWSDHVSINSKPEKCSFGTCICLCNGDNIAACQNKGFCKEIEKEEVLVSVFYEHFAIQNSFGLSNYSNVEISCIGLKPNLLEFNVTQNDQQLRLTRSIKYGQSPSIFDLYTENPGNCKFLRGTLFQSSQQGIGTGGGI